MKEKQGGSQPKKDFDVDKIYKKAKKHYDKTLKKLRDEDSKI